MFGLDQSIAGLGGGGGLALALGVALLLGLRHATDPDHLTAVSTLVMSEERRGPRVAARLGLAWGMGHACTLFALGLPFVLLHDRLPHWLQQGLELAVGLVIVVLAIRLLIRWRRGYLHSHTHRHDNVVHAHPHVHEGEHGAAHAHAHSHRHDVARSPLAAFGIGLIHGAGGSAGLGVLLVAAVPGAAHAVAALAILSAGTAVSMTAVSAGFGWAVGRGPVLRHFEALAPALGIFSLAFGAWYALGALEAVPYFF